MTDTSTTHYGRGWSFPPSFTLDAQGQGAVVMVQDTLDIQQSLRILLSTQLGERIMRPGFGCDLQSALFENLDTGLLAMLRRLISDSIQRHEPRVVLLNVDAQADPAQPSRLKVQISYRIRNAYQQGLLQGEFNSFNHQGLRWL